MAARQQASQPIQEVDQAVQALPQVLQPMAVVQCSVVLVAGVAGAGTVPQALPVLLAATPDSLTWQPAKVVPTVPQVPQA